MRRRETAAKEWLRNVVLAFAPGVLKSETSNFSLAVPSCASQHLEQLDNNYTMLQLNQTVETPLGLKITDNIGQVIFDSKVSFATGTYNINTTGYASGIYYVDLYSNADKVFGGKLCIFRK